MIGFDWENIKKMIPPIVPHVISNIDTSNFANSKKKYEDEEKKNPFYGQTGDDSSPPTLKKTTLANDFELTRIDLLREMNEEDIQKLEYISLSIEFNCE